MSVKAIKEIANRAFAAGVVGSETISDLRNEARKDGSISTKEMAALEKVAEKADKLADKGEIKYKKSARKYMSNVLGEAGRTSKASKLMSIAVSGASASNTYSEVRIEARIPQGTRFAYTTERDGDTLTIFVGAKREGNAKASFEQVDTEATIPVDFGGTYALNVRIVDPQTKNEIDSFKMFDSDDD